MALPVVMIAGVLAWLNQPTIADQWRRWVTERPFLSANVWPYILKPEDERALYPGKAFRECAPRQKDSDYCPDMVVVPAGPFRMGSSSDPAAYPSEFPQHPVTIAQAFAVSKFEVTFDEWDTCADHGGCSSGISDREYGRGSVPVINVNWDDAHQYVNWLSKITGKTYRLLTEAEYEYATRAGTTTAYPWGKEIGSKHANCKECGSKWDNHSPAPVGTFTSNGFVGSFAPNAFGLYDMVGNVWEWVQDCWHPNYEGAPSDGRAWTEGDCKRHVNRGGSFEDVPRDIRSANRYFPRDVDRDTILGFRVARTLSAGASAITLAPGVRSAPSPQ